MCTAVLEGVYPGKVFVDNPIRPRSALLTTYIESEASGTWGFLAGDPIDWGGQMDVVLSPRPPIWLSRYHFVSRKVNFDWRTALPEGFAVKPINKELANTPGLELPTDIADTLQKWQTIQPSSQPTNQSTAQHFRD